ncbi:MAG TPA: OmpA family protein [Vicinamibacterales bacterium]|nr:OmpA family protein [Vicinamibacterales bacterium]
MKWLIPLVILLMSATAPALAQAPEEGDAEGCKDSPILTRMPGCAIAECESKEFDAAEVWTGPWQEGERQMLKLEGKVEQMRYVCPEKLSLLQIQRNAEAALRKAGFTIVYGGPDYDEWPIVSARKGTQWIQVATSPGDYPQYRQLTVLVEKMKQEQVADASSMAAEIEKTGSVAVYGINFDTGKATITSGSEKVLQEVLSLMQQQADWRFEVQGHTDSVGSKASNQALSEQRAAAVAAWLAKNGIASARLTSRGYGDAVPVADNATEEGRARNRRVELKKIE